jgi:hypothetical protein
MGWWRTFLDSLDSSGGHIVLMFLLMAMGMGMIHRGMMEGGTVVAGSFGALLTMLKEKGSNREQSGQTTTTAQVQTVVQPEPVMTNGQS